MVIQPITKFGKVRIGNNISSLKIVVFKCFSHEIELAAKNLSILNASLIITNSSPAKEVVQINKRIQQYQIERHLGIDLLDNTHLHVLQPTPQGSTVEAHFSLLQYHP